LQAGQLALLSHAHLTLVHITNLQELAHVDVESTTAPVLHERAHQRGLDILEQAQNRLRAQVEIESHLHIGESWQGRRDMAAVLVKFANAHDADLIVLGTHGRGGLLHMLMGNFAENVMRIASCPLLIVQSAVHPKEGDA